MTVLMVAHRLDTAVRYCERILVLDQGRVEQFADPLSLLCEDPTEHLAITRYDSIFADMVRALSEGQQNNILELATRNRISQDEVMSNLQGYIKDKKEQVDQEQERARYPAPIGRETLTELQEYLKKNAK